VFWGRLKIDRWTWGSAFGSPAKAGIGKRTEKNGEEGPPFVKKNVKGRPPGKKERRAKSMTRKS
jgi:hypothetical protein